MDCLRKLKKFRSALSETVLFGGSNLEVNELIEEVKDNLDELEEFIKDDIFAVSDNDDGFTPVSDSEH